MSGGFSNYQTLGHEVPKKGAPMRSIPERVKQYHLLDYLTPASRVLDIGCNRGYFGILLSPRIKSYIGIDHDAAQLKYGNTMIAANKLKNVSLQCIPFERYPVREWQFDAIFSFAVHAYSKFPMCDYAAKMYRGLADKGVIVLEGHPRHYLGEPAKLNALVGLLEGHFAMHRKFHTTVKDRANLREVYVWQKL